MIINLNADKNLNIHASYDEKLKSSLTGSLSRFTDNITRIEVHLSDENGGKVGPNDKRCMLEARIEGRPPIAVTHSGNTHDQAVNGAIDKLKSSLDSILGKLKNH